MNSIHSPNSLTAAGGSSAHPPVAIVGMSALMPGSQDSQGFWRDILSGRDLITEVPRSHWLTSDYYDPNPKALDKTYAKRGAFLSAVDFDPMEFGVPPTALPAIDTAQLLALIVAQRVLQDAAQGQFQYQNRERISVILGMAGATELFSHMSARLGKPVWANALRESGFKPAQVDELCERIAAHYVTWQENTFPGLLGNVVAGRIANRLDLGGTNCVVDAACAGSLAAVSIGLNELYSGQSDVSIVGGVDTLNDIIMYMCFSAVGALSKTGDCRPFSVDADGTMIGEGLAMFALKRLADAERDGDRIYAVIRALGTSSDGRAKSIYAPLPQGQAKALRRAYEGAGYSPATVELVEAHGTGTIAGDLAEFEGLRSVFGATEGGAKQYCALGSVKAQVGHTKATAGSAGLFKAAMALHHKILPQTAKITQPNPKLNLKDSPFYLNTETRPWIRDAQHPRRAGVSAFGFGGTNFHVALEEYTGPAQKAWKIRTLPSELVVYSADQPAEILAWCQKTAHAFAPGSLTYLAQQTQCQYDAQRPARLAIVAKDEADLQQKFQQVITHLQQQPQQPLAMKGVYYARSAQAPGKMAWLFPGQGSQYRNMGVDWALHFSSAQAVWDQIATLGLTGSLALHQVVFPIPVFSPEEQAQQEALLTRTEWAQPAIGAVSLSVMAILKQLGLAPDAVAGHSFGEVTALHAAQVFDADTFMRIAHKRGELMGEACKVPGAMTAVMAPLDKLQPLLANWALDVVLANHNSPEQLVYSGKIEAIEQLEQHLKNAAIKFRRLSVATAFHSPLVSSSCEPFKQFLKGLAIQKPVIPVYSNTEVEPYPANVATIRKRLGEQLAHPVRFVEQIEALYQAGVRIFMEVGPSTVLSNLTQRCLQGRECTVIALDQKGKSGITSLWEGLAQLVIQGIAPDFKPLWAEYAPLTNPLERVKTKFSVPLNGANYKKPYPPPAGQTVTQGPLKTLDFNVKPAAPVPASPVPASPVMAPPAIAAVQSAPAQPVKPAMAATPKPAPAAKAVAVNAVNNNPVNHSVNNPNSAPLQPAPSLSLSPQQGVRPHMNTTYNTVSTPRPAPAMAMPAWLQAYQLMQQQTADAHRYYQQTMAESHLAFLRSAETSFAGLVQLATGSPMGMNQAVMQPVITPAPAPMPMPVLAPAPVMMAAPAIAPTPVPAPAPVAPAPVMSAPPMPAVAVPSAPPAPIAATPGAPMPAPMVAAPAATPVAPAPMQPPKAVTSGVDLKAALLTVVADKTGYPQDMLDLSMALESDLGIDSIKRVEIFSALQEQVPGLPEADTQQLAQLHTLGAILAFYGYGVGEAVTTSTVATPAPAVSAPAVSTAAMPAVAAPPAAEVGAIEDTGSALKAALLDVVADKTGYPEEMLDLSMALESDLGIDSIKRVEIFSALQEKLPGLPEVETSQLAALATLGDIIAHYVEGSLPAVIKKKQTLNASFSA